MVAFDLQGRRIVVTGAAAGIGQAIARELTRAGAKVALVDRDFDGVRALADELGPTSLPIMASVDDPGQISTAMAQVDGAWGGLDGLVANAGMNANKPTLDLSHEEWRRAVDVNLNGTFYVAQEAGRRMVAQGTGGTIVNMGSIYSVVAGPNRAAYCATKAAVAMLTKVLAVEWAEHGIRVNAVAPGYVATRATEILVEEGRLDVAAIERRTPLGRMAAPADIAQSVGFLMSDQASYITGQILGVDGGWTAYGYI